MKKKNKKILSKAAKAGIVTSLIAAPYANYPLTVEAVNSWPADEFFIPYLKNDGTIIFDPADEPGISPDDVDFTSGIGDGSGDQPSFYVYSDGTNLFFRMRLLGNPTDSKGGFLSSVWEVALGFNGEHKATVGLNGKSPHEDYVYISNADGTVLKKVYTTDTSGSNVPGTQVRETEEGHYFLDFQVPISKVTEIASEITADSPVQFYFGTSKAANLSVINKDFMGPQNSKTTISFSEAAGVKLSDLHSIYIPAIEVTSLSTDASTGKTTINGTTTNAQIDSEIEVTVNEEIHKTKVQDGNSWSLSVNALPAGVHTINAKVTNELGNIGYSTEQLQEGQLISIDGPAELFTTSFPAMITGTFANSSGGSKRVKVEVFKLLFDGSIANTAVFSESVSANGTWSFSGINITDPGGYQVRAVEITGNNKEIPPEATQTITVVEPAELNISSVVSTSSNDAYPVIKGTSSEQNKQVSIVIDGRLYGRTMTTEDGLWEYPVQPSLATGPHIIFATIEDEYKNVVESNQVNYQVNSISITIVNGDSVALNDNKPTIRGRSTAPDNSPVAVTITKKGTTDSFVLDTIVHDGKWNVTVPEEKKLADDVYEIEAVVTNNDAKALARQELKIDASNTVNFIKDFPGSITEDRKQTIAGKTEPGSTVDINLDNGSIVGTVFADEAGDWEYIPATDLEYGLHTVTVTSADLVGNEAKGITSFIVKNPANLAPKTTDYKETILSGQSAIGQIKAEDPENTLLTFSKKVDAVNGVVTVETDGSWHYEPKAGFKGSDSFKVEVSDGFGGIAESVVTIEVFNRPPAAKEYNETTLSGVTKSGKVETTDPEGDPLIYLNGKLPTNGTVIIGLNGVWTYRPNDKFVGYDSFTVIAEDTTGALAEVKVNITVQNQVPVVEDDQVVTLLNTEKTGQLTGTDPEGSILTYQLQTGPSYGDVQIAPDGNWIYEPEADYIGEDSFTVEVADELGGKVISTVFVRIQAPLNQRPTVVNYTEETVMDKSVSGKVEGTDPDGDTLTYAQKAEPLHGTVTVQENGAWTYTPNQGYTGTDSFTIEVTDSHGSTVMSTVTVEIKQPSAPENQFPVIGNLLKETFSGKSVTGTLEGIDPDHDPLIYSKKSGPSYGAVTVETSGIWTYTPYENYIGTDSFMVEVSDGRGGTAVSTITIKVKQLPVQLNQPPTVGNESYTILKNAKKSGVVTGIDPDGDSLTYHKKSDPVNGTAEVNANGSWIYTPEKDFTGIETFSIEISDGRGGTAVSTVTITITEPPAQQNQVPTTKDYTTGTAINKNISGQIEAEDADADSLLFELGTQPANGSVNVNADGTWIYTPIENYTGKDTFTVDVTDGKGGKATSTVIIDVKPAINQFPTVGNDEYVLDAGTEKQGVVVGQDPDGDALIYRIKTNPEHGTVEMNANGSWTYKPHSGFLGKDSFQVQISDNRGGEATATLTLIVKEPEIENNEPTVQSYHFETAKNQAKEGTAAGEDKDGDLLTYSAGKKPVHGTIVVQETGVWLYTPNPEFVGIDGFTIIVSDGKSPGVASSITVEVKPPANQAPAVRNYSLSAVSDQEKKGAVAGSDTDGDLLIYSKKTNPANGTVSVRQDGTWTYIPAKGFSGEDSFTVEVSDGNGGTAVSVVTIVVQALPAETENQPPAAENDAVETVKNSVVTGMVKGTDPDGDKLTYQHKAGPTHGKVTVTTDGSWSYTPELDYTGKDSFTISILDDHGNTSSSTITIQVNQPAIGITINGGETASLVDRNPLIDGKVQATESSLVVVEIKDLAGKLIEKGSATVKSGGWVYQVNRILNPDEYRVNATVTDKKHGSQRMASQDITILEVPLTAALKATPEKIVADGKSTTTIQIIVKDSNGAPVTGEKVNFKTKAGILKQSSTVTNEQGLASVVLTAPDLSGSTEKVVNEVTAFINNPDKGIILEKTASVSFIPASIQGVVVNYGTNQPIAGATVRIMEDFNKDGVLDYQTSTKTDAFGRYQIPVPYGNWDYKVHISALNEIDGITFPQEFIQHAKVGKLEGKGEQVATEKTVSGQLFIMNKETNKAERLMSNFKEVKMSATVLNDPTESVQVEVDNETGMYQVIGGEKGRTYELALHIKVKDASGIEQTLVGKKLSLKIPEEGVASVQATLIDPYGVVTDADTGEVIKGVEMRLYWADTALNRSKGRIPHSIVHLPILEGFAPNNNKSPQFTSDEGNYAWMVFPDGDYYIVAEKSGYEVYDSRTERRTVAVKEGEDSYITNGIIHVGQSIVKYDLSMVSIKETSREPEKEPANHKPEVSNYSFNTVMNTSISNKVVSTDEDGDSLSYRKVLSAEYGSVSVKNDGSFVYTPVSGFSGTDRFVIEVTDGKGGTAEAVITIQVQSEKKETVVNDQIVTETFQNREITGKLEDIQIFNPSTLQLKAPVHGKADVNFTTGVWSYMPNKDYTGEDEFVIYYQNAGKTTFQKTIKVIVHPEFKQISIGSENSKSEEPKVIPVEEEAEETIQTVAEEKEAVEIKEEQSGLKELPKTGSILDRNILLGLGGLLTLVGAAMRKLGRRKEKKK